MLLAWEGVCLVAPVLADSPGPPRLPATEADLVEKAEGGSGLWTPHVCAVVGMETQTLVGTGVMGCEGQVFSLQPVLMMGEHGTGRRDRGAPDFSRGACIQNAGVRC